MGVYFTRSVISHNKFKEKTRFWIRNKNTTLKQTKTLLSSHHNADEFCSLIKVWVYHFFLQRPQGIDCFHPFCQKIWQIYTFTLLINSLFVCSQYQLCCPWSIHNSVRMSQFYLRIATIDSLVVDLFSQICNTDQLSYTWFFFFLFVKNDPFCFFALISYFVFLLAFVLGLNNETL